MTDWHKKTFRWTVRITAGLFALLLIAVFLLISFIDYGRITQEVQAMLSRQAGGAITFQKIDVSIFPRPHVTVHQPAFTFENSVSGTSRSFIVYPEILPLFIGKVRIGALIVSAPSITILKSKPVAGKTAEEPVSFAQIQSDITQVLTSLRDSAPNIIIKIEDGSCAVSEKGRRIFSVSKLRVLIDPVAEGFDVKISGDTDRLGPLAMEGRIAFTGTSLQLAGMAVRIGRSSISGLSAEMIWEAEPVLAVRSARAALFLDEILKRASAFKELRKFTTDVRALKGLLTLNGTRIDGPLLRPAAWRAEATGELRDITVESSVLPGVLNIQRGLFKWTGNKLLFTELQANIMDASLRLSFALDDIFKGIGSVTADGDGTLGRESVRWLSKLLELPQTGYLRVPLFLTNNRFVWQRGDIYQYSGSITVSNGPLVSISLRSDPKELVISSFSIADKRSNFKGSFSNSQKGMNIAFSGHLDQSTTERLFEGSPFPYGWIAGDLTAHIVPDNPAQSSAQGTLDAENIVIARWFKSPLRIEKISLVADRNSVTIRNAAFIIADNRFSASGMATAKTKKFIVDMDLFSPGINLEALHAMLKDDEEEKQEGAGHFPVEGIIRITSPAITYGRHTAKAVKAIATLAPEMMSLDIRECTFCGIPASGIISLAGDIIAMTGNASAENLSLDPMFTCLTNDNLKLTGTLAINAKLSASGTKDALMSTLRGTVHLNATDGVIYRYPALAKILALVNVTEILRGKLPDLASEGFGYESIALKSSITGGKVKLDEALINGNSMNISATGSINLVDKSLRVNVLVAPLKTVDYVISKIPVVSTILDNSLIAIPVKVRGKMGEAEVSVMAPDEVGEGLLRMLKRTVTLPLKIIEPFMPEEKKKE